MYNITTPQRVFIAQSAQYRTNLEAIEALKSVYTGLSYQVRQRSYVLLGSAYLLTRYTVDGVFSAITATYTSHSLSSARILTIDLNELKYVTTEIMSSGSALSDQTSLAQERSIALYVYAA